MCLNVALCCYRGAPEAQLVGHTKRSQANHMETSLCKPHDLQFCNITCSALYLGLLHSICSQSLSKLHFFVSV